MRLSEGDVVDAVEEVTLRRLRLWIKKGWITPVVCSEGFEFDEIDVARVRFVCELKDELNMNEDAVDVVLSLIDQIHGLRGEIRKIAQAVDRQPVNVKRDIVTLVQNLRQ